jgi:chemotaxis protein CheD
MAREGRATGADRTVHRIGIADFAVDGDGAVLSTSGLGSCLGVGLYDESTGVAGLAHVMLPDAPAEPSNPAKYTDSGIAVLLEAMRTEGANVEDVRAKLAGGSAMFGFDSQEHPIGERNVETARTVLERRGVPVVAEDVGGDSGRSVRFHGATGELVVRSASAERRL